MKIIDLQQRTPEWDEFRRSRIGASDTAAVMGVSSYKTSRQLWNEKIKGLTSQQNAAMAYGNAHEDEVRRYFNAKYYCNAIPMVGVHDTNDWQFASFDAIDLAKGVFAEIKCPYTKESWLKVVEHEIPPEWLWQVMKQCYISGFDGGYITVLNPTMEGDKTCDFMIQRDEEMISALVAKETEFYQEYMLKFIEPPMTDRDYLERHDDIWMRAAERARIAMVKLETAQKEADEAREALISLTNGQSCRGGGVRATKYLAKGNVDYTSIPVLKGIDLDTYRKPASERWRITQA